VHSHPCCEPLPVGAYQIYGLSPALTRAPGRLPLLHSDMKTLREAILESEVS
jgi:hypothetical protein